MQQENRGVSDGVADCWVCLGKHRALKIATIAIVAAFLMTGCDNNGDSHPPGPVGWAIGTSNQDGSAVILYTGNGGLNWEAQGDTSMWAGHGGNDISAVDDKTAWAALSESGDQGGLILHTTNGGNTWAIQDLPEEIPMGVKGIKGVSRDEAWAVGLEGPVMHTLDGGQNWEIVPTGGIIIAQVNRMDVLGDNIWIADYGSGDTGMIHSADYGKTWRKEQLPSVPAGLGPMTISIVNSQVAWTNINLEPNIYRTRNGGDIWTMDAPEVSGPNDIDDLCAVSENKVWAVQNANTAGIVLRISITGSQVDKKDWFFPDYRYEGVSAFDESTAWIVGIKTIGGDESRPDGSILYTSDGETWTSQPLPVSNAGLWKVSFAGARR